MNVNNVSVGKPKIGGSIYTAPLGTELPTDANSDLSSAWKQMGYASEDGVVNNNSPESTNIKAWGGDTVLTVLSSRDDTYKYTLIEVLNVDVLKFVYGSSNVSGDLDSGIHITANNKDSEICSIVIDMELTQGVLKRVVIPKGKVSEVGEISYTDEDAVGYETTVACLPDSDGNTHHEYIQKPATSRNWTVTFESNGGSAVASQTVANNGKATEPTDPTKDGYTFSGWYLPTDLSTPYDFDTAVTGNIALYAKWEA